MTSARRVLVRPLLLGFIFLHASAYVLRKRGWDNELNDALRILQDQGGDDELIFEDREEQPEALWSSDERQPGGYFYRDYDRAGDQDSADLDAAEDRLLLENFLDQEGQEFGEAPVEEESDFPDDIGNIPVAGDLQDIPLNPSESELEEVPVDKNEMQSILESSENDEDEKEEKRGYHPISVIKKSPDEVKIMATLTPNEVKDLLEEAEETEEKVLSDAVEQMEEKAKNEGEPRGYVTKMEENIQVEPVSKDELQDVFDEEPKVKVQGSVSVDAKPLGGSTLEGVDEAGGPWREIEMPPADTLTKENVLDYIAQSDDSLFNRKRKRAEISLNSPEVAREYIKTFLDLEDNENNNLANALNLATLAQVERTDRYVKREAKFIRKAIQDEEKLQNLRKQLKSLEEAPSTEDSVKSQGPQLLKRVEGFEDEENEDTNLIEDDEDFRDEEAAAEDLAEAEAEAEAEEEAVEEDRVEAMREALRQKLQEFLLQSSADDSKIDPSALQWLNQPLNNFRPEDIDEQDIGELHLNPFWREIMSRYEENEVEKRGDEYDVPEDIEDLVDDEDIATDDSPEEEVSDVLESYVNSLTPLEKAELQEKVNEELSEVEEEMCPAIDLTDGCLFAAKMGLRLDEEARDLCNRHQLCYMCGSAHGLGSLQCDSGYMEEADHLCDIERDSLSCKQDALDFFTLMTQAHTFAGEEYPEECYSSCTLDYIYGLTKK